MSSDRFVFCPKIKGMKKLEKSLYDTRNRKRIGLHHTIEIYVYV